MIFARELLTWTVGKFTWTPINLLKRIFVFLFSVDWVIKQRKSVVWKKSLTEDVECSFDRQLGSRDILEQVISLANDKVRKAGAETDAISWENSQNLKHFIFSLTLGLFGFSMILIFLVLLTAKSHKVLRGDLRGWMTQEHHLHKQWWTSADELWLLTN